jgi:hypothetical protein
MRIDEVEQHEENSSISFIKDMIENCGKSRVAFLIRKPLFRGFRHTNNLNSDFGIFKILEERKPKDMTFCMQKLVDEELKKRGFDVFRKNSIFCSGDINFASRFGKVYRIFPPMQAKFLWNRKSQDFFSFSYRVFDIDVDYLVKNYKKEIYPVIAKLYKLNESFINFDKEKFDNILKDDMLYKTLVIKIADFYKTTKMFSFFASNLEKILKEDCNYLVLHSNDKIFDYFTNSNFEEAVRSGNEIMIKSDYVYYISEDHFVDMIEDLIDFV